MVGQCIAHYEILELLGSGGMGRVYRAFDSRLQREVALKILPPRAAADPSRRQRFEREARAVAALDHPNIVTVYSIEEACDEGGQTLQFITMQLVEGRVLSERIPEGGFPLSEFFGLAIPLADAIAAAHRQNIVHRDLKPSNIMISEDGRPRILDFGLAKLLQKDAVALGAGRAPSGPGPAEPTQLTGEGRILGTADYMSPEQVEGKRLDHRSDIFSLGILLHELATGERPFQGKSSVSVIASIVKDAPISVTDLKPELPRHLARIIKHALEKDPKRRFQSARDLRNELAELRQEIISGESEAPRARRSSPISVGLIWAAPAIALLAVSVLIWSYFSDLSFRGTPARAVPLTSLLGMELDPAVSPNGSQVAFAWDGVPGGSFDLYVKLIDAGDPLRLTTNPLDDRHPAWSPTGREIVFLRRTAPMNYDVLAVPGLGGPERLLGAVSNTAFPGLDWSPDGGFLALVHRSPGDDTEAVYRLDIATRQLSKLTHPPSSASGDKLPALSPRGRVLAFVRWYEAKRSDVYLLRLESGKSELLTAHPGIITGLDWLEDGSGLVVSSKSADGSASLWSISLEGQVTQLFFGEDASSLSVAGVDRVVYSRALLHSNVWRTAGPAAEGPVAPERLIASTRNDWSPHYAPDGERIAIASDRAGLPQIWICRSDGSNCYRLADNGPMTIPRWSPDGTRLSVGTEHDGHVDIEVVEVESGLVQRLTEGESTDAAWSWSRDGRWIYYFSDRSGEYQVWKIPAEGGEARQITRNGGVLPVESGDGVHVYYFKFTDPFSIWRAPVDGGEETLVLQEPSMGRSGFLLWQDQLIYVLDDAEEGLSISSHNPTTGETRVISRLDPTTRLAKYRRLSASPDGRWIAYPRAEGLDADLILVENFR